MHAALTSFCLCFGVWWVVSVPIVVAADSCILLSNPLHLRMLISFNIYYRYTVYESMSFTSSKSCMNLCFENFSHPQSLVWLNPVLRGSHKKWRLGSTRKSGTVMLFSNGLRPTAIVGETQSCGGARKLTCWKLPIFCLWKYRNESLVLLMEEILHHLEKVVYPIIYKAFCILGGWPDFFHQVYIRAIQ